MFLSAPEKTLPKTAPHRCHGRALEGGDAGGAALGLRAGLEEVRGGGEDAVARLTRGQVARRLEFGGFGVWLGFKKWFLLVKSQGFWWDSAVSEALGRCGGGLGPKWPSGLGGGEGLRGHRGSEEEGLRRRGFSDLGVVWRFLSTYLSGLPKKHGTFEIFGNGFCLVFFFFFWGGGGVGVF